jgi:long-chain acyl-CoA synthetase
MIEKTIPEVFFETVSKYPAKPALLHKKDGVYFPITYQELSEKVKVFATCLQKFGIKKEDKVAILSENRPEWVVSDLAVMLIGGISVPLHTTFNPKAICNILNHSQAKILIISNSDLLNKVLLEKTNLQHLERIIFMDKLTEMQKESFRGKIFGWQSLCARNQTGLYEKIFSDSDDVCSIIYTSGTTGDPKGVLLTHKNFLSNVEAVSQVIPVKKSDIFLSFLPLSHVLERLAGYYTPLAFGATIAYAESIKQLPANLKEIRPTLLISVPRVFEKFHDTIWDKIRTSKTKNNFFQWALKQKRGSIRYRIADYLVFKTIREHLGGRLRLAISGGASLNDKIARFFLKIGILVLEGYGLTETSPVVAVNREKDFKFGTVGKPVPGVKVKISSDKEVLVKGPNVTQGYFKNPEATKSAFDSEGWFRTGDMGFLNQEGFLTVIGRKKEMIVTSGGKNVWPEPIENLLNKDRFIVNSIVVGDRRKFVSALMVPDWEEVNLYLKKKNLVAQEPEKLIKHPEVLRVFQERIDRKINPSLSDFEKIKKFKLIAHDFSQEREELTPTLKLRRHIVERHYEKEIEEMYS